MFAVLGAAGLWAVQHLARKRHEQQRQQQQRGAAQNALNHGVLGGRARAAAALTAGDGGSPVKGASSGHCLAIVAADDALCGSPSKTPAGRRALGFHFGRGSAALRDGMLVVFKDRTGQCAVVQPYGSGSSWQLAVTCATGGCCMLPHGVGGLSYVGSDAVFLVRQVGSNYAFLSMGAEGRYLAALRDLNAVPVLDSNRLTPAAQWRVSGHHSISNAHYTHKKLALTVCEVKPVHSESMAALDAGISSLVAQLGEQVASGEAAIRSLQSQLQSTTNQAARAAAEHESRVTYLGNQLGEACSFNSQLTALLEQRDHKIASLKEHAAQLKHKCTAAERELSAAYSEVASLQAQLGERDDEIGQLHDSMRNEAQQWAEVQCALHDSLAAKEGEVVALNQALQRMEAALRAVEHMLYGARKPRRVDRASLDAVSIQQLQAAVEQFAAVGSSDSSAAHHGSSRHPPSTQEAEALALLLDQAPGGGFYPSASLQGNCDLDAEPGAALPLHDLERLDQSPRKQAPQQHLFTDAGTSMASGAAKAAGAQLSPSKASGMAAGGRDGAIARSSSRGARSSATSEGRHRYSGDVSDADDDSQAGDDEAASHKTAEGEGDAADVLLCRSSMDEAELQRELRLLKASASRLSRRALSPVKEAGGGGAGAAQ